MHSNRQHAKHSRRQSVVQAEGAARSVLHIEGDRLQSTHVEQCLVLDAAEARMMQEVAEHEASWFCGGRDMSGRGSSLLLGCCFLDLHVCIVAIHS